MNENARYRRNRFFGNLAVTAVMTIVILSCLLFTIPNISTFVEQSPVHIMRALERTAAQLGSTLIGYQDISISGSDGLSAFAQREGMSAENLQIFIAAAHENGIKPAHMLGFTAVETAYCANIGSAVAIDEAQMRLNEEMSGKNRPQYVEWWSEQTTALQNLAATLAIDVRSIPGSSGAGAISCYQLMPSNWMHYGGGDFRNIQMAADHAAKYLLENGYKADDPRDAIIAYNPLGGESYVASVLAKAAEWSPYFEDVTITQAPYIPKKEINSGLEVVAVFLENLSLEMSGKPPATNETTGSESISISDLVYPIPGVPPSGYTWLAPVYAWSEEKKESVLVAYHTGQDYSGYGQIIAAHSGIVTFARYLDKNEPQAVAWWISGNVVVIKGTLSDGTTFCTFYGHGEPGSMQVQKNEVIAAGQPLMMSGNTGFSDGVHLHFSIKVGGNGDYCDGGDFVDPNKYVGP